MQLGPLAAETINQMFHLLEYDHQICAKIAKRPKLQAVLSYNLT